MSAEGGEVLYSGRARRGGVRVVLDERRRANVGMYHPDLFKPIPEFTRQAEMARKKCETYADMVVLTACRQPIGVPREPVIVPCGWTRTLERYWLKVAG